MNLIWNHLICARINDQLKKILKFAFVGATGAILNLLLLWFLTSSGLYYIFSAIFAIEVSIFWNFYFNSKITFNYKFLDRYDLCLGILKYHLASLVGTSVNILALIILTEYFKIFYLVSEIIAIFLAFGLNYFISINLVWKTKGN